MARSKKQTTGPYPRRLTRVQRAADRRWQADEPPSDDGTEDPLLVEATVECQSEVFETTDVDVDVDQPETTSPMAGRHLSRSQIITARRHATVATATGPKTTSEASIPVTGGANLPVSTTLPPPTVTAGNLTTTPNPNLPLNTTLTHSYTMEFVDDAHVVITHHHSTTSAGISTAGHQTTTSVTPNLDPNTINPNPNPVRFEILT